MGSVRDLPIISFYYKLRFQLTLYSVESSLVSIASSVPLLRSLVIDNQSPRSQPSNSNMLDRHNLKSKQPSYHINTQRFSRLGLGNIDIAGADGNSPTLKDDQSWILKEVTYSVKVTDLEDGESYGRSVSAMGQAGRADSWK